MNVYMNAYMNAYTNADQVTITANVNTNNPKLMPTQMLIGPLKQLMPTLMSLN